MRSPAVNGLCSLALRLARRRVVVVGGGGVAERKVRRLLNYEPQLLIISPTLSNELEMIVNNGGAKWIKRKACSADFAGAFLVLLATDDPQANAELAAAARAAGALVNRADDPEDCDFVFGASLKRGPVEVSVFSGGDAPALAAWLRDKLESAVGEDVEDFADFFAKLRDEVIGSWESADERGEVLRRLLSSGLYEVFRERGRMAAEEFARKEIGTRGR